MGYGLGPLSAEAAAFGADLLAAAAHTLPSAIVVDIGRTPDGWAVIEANAAWAGGHYTADPEGALDVVLRAAAPAGAVGEHDRRFVRRPAPAPAP